MAEDKNAAHAAAEEFAAWLAQTQPARTVSECYAAIIEADAFLLKRNLSRRSLFLLDKRSVVSLLTSLRGNRVFRSQATVSMQKMQKAAALLGDFIDERDQRIADKLLGILTQSKPEAMKPSVASTSEPVEEPRPPVPTLLENRIFTFDGTDLRAAVINNKLHYVDHLAAEGAFWLVGGQELEPFVALAKEKGYDFNFKQEGSRSSNWMPCWWYQPTKKLEAPPVPAVTYFNGMLDDPQYVPLRDALIQNGIADLEALRNINLWLFMNSHNLYTIQRRLAISNELHDKLQILDTVSDAAESCVIFVFDKEFKGATPSDAFAALMAYVATKYPLRFRSVCSLIHPKTMKVVLRRNDYDGSRIKLINPEVYIDRDLTKEQIEEYTDWVLTKCTGNAPTFSVACSEAKQNEPESVSHIVKKAENCLLAADLDGLSLDDLQAELGMRIVGTKETAAQSPCIIEMGGRFYHQEAFVDFEEAADAMTEILDKLIKKNNGVVSTKQMVEYARSEMQMFLNDNGLTDPRQIIDLAQHLFDKVKYKGVHYVFKGNLYISAPDAVMETFSDIVRNFALTSSSIVTYDAIKEYVTRAGLNADNIRGKMKINTAPDFLVYDENEYLLSESMHIDNAFLDKVKSALERLFADAGDHIILRGIAPGWYSLLPELPYGLSWTPMLLQQVIRYWGKRLGARTIQAMDSQDSNVVHAMLVSEDSIVQDFRDAVAVYLYEELPDRDRYAAEELRGILVKASMLQGNELINNMHKALSQDPRFIWSNENQSVRVML